jgi:hypothetical protein
MTSGGNRNPANADTGGDQERLLADLIDQACLDHANDQRNRPIRIALIAKAWRNLT